MQKKIDADFFSIIDTTHKPKKFFENQNLVNYKKMWFLHDHIQPTSNVDMSYLKSFEEKYNINLWTLAVNERLFYRFNEFYKFSKLEILSILEKECKLFEEILNSINPNFVILHEPFFHTDELFYRICKAKGVKILMSYVSNFGYKWEISQNNHVMDIINEFDNTSSKGRNFGELEEAFNQENVSKFLKNVNEHTSKNKIEFIKSAINFGLKTKNINSKIQYTYFGRTKLKVLINTLNNYFKTNNRKKFIDKKLTKSVDYTANYVYFPLHIEQERTSLIETPFYTNQIEFIRNIVKSLPINYTLYVKEHPTQSQRHWRDKKVYSEIMNIPNIILIHPDISSKKLIENSSLVITLSGTAALEAAFLQKPSITFADSDYTKISSIERVRSVEDLPKMIRNSLKKEITPDDLDRYVSLIENYAFDSDTMAFQDDILNRFFHGGLLVDENIHDKNMEEFLVENEKKLEEFTNQHIKKIEFLKKVS